MDRPTRSGRFNLPDHSYDPTPYSRERDIAAFQQFIGSLEGVTDRIVAVAVDQR